MSSLSNRKGPNVSQYIAGLNTIDTASPEDIFTEPEAMSLFASTDFFDFDMGSTSLPGQDFDSNQTERKQTSTSWQDPPTQDFLGGDFQFPDLASFSGPLAAGPHAAFAPSTFPLQQSIISPVSDSLSSPKTGEKRKSNVLGDMVTPSANMDENSRLAAEEDKRRRNTAASARFRIKKKQREQALEQSAKEMSEKTQRLETKVQQLEMENRWLKSLITEKNDSVDQDGRFQELYEKYTKGEGRPMSLESRSDGVGTSTAKVEDLDGLEMSDEEEG